MFSVMSRILIEDSFQIFGQCACNVIYPLSQHILHWISYRYVVFVTFLKLLTNSQNHIDQFNFFLALNPRSQILQYHLKICFYFQPKNILWYNICKNILSKKILNFLRTWTNRTTWLSSCLTSISVCVTSFPC